MFRALPGTNFTPSRPEQVSISLCYTAGGVTRLVVQLSGKTIRSEPTVQWDPRSVAVDSSSMNSLELLILEKRADLTSWGPSFANIRE